MRLLATVLVAAVGPVLLACGDTPPKTPATTTTSAQPPMQPQMQPQQSVVAHPPPVQQSQGAPGTTGTVPPAAAYTVAPLDLGPHAEGLVLDIGKPVKSQSGITATLGRPERKDNGTDAITTWTVKVAYGMETMDVIVETSDLYFEGAAFGHLIVLRDKPENRDQAVLTVRPNAPQPLTNEEAVKLAEAEVAKRNLPHGTKITPRSSGGVVTVSFEDANGGGTVVQVGRFTRAVRDIRPIVGKKSAGH